MRQLLTEPEIGAGDSTSGELTFTLLARTSAGAGAGAGTEAAGAGDDAGAAEVGVGTEAALDGAGAGVDLAGAGAEAEAACPEKMAPFSRDMTLGVKSLPVKNSPAVTDGSGDGAGGKMSDWKESA
jgi:hypothetical protein